MSEYRWQILEGDALEVLAGMEPASFDAIVTDPPYGLEFMGVAWDTMRDDGKPRTRNEWGDFGSREHARKPEEAAPIRAKKSRALQAFSAGWAEAVLRVLKPGAHLVAFGGTRTYHRLACAVEDAGFEIRDSLMWIYGSGFPKSLNLNGDWKGWGTALKPAHEPIILARKPLVGTVAANVAEHGTGALNVDGCRVECANHPGVHKSMSNTLHEGYQRPWRDGGPPQYKDTPAGRWPPNVLLTHAADCGDECGPCCPIRLMDEQSGEGTSTGGTGEASKRTGGVCGWTPSNTGGKGDSGGASRFFPRFRYEAKASTSERNAGLMERSSHPTVKPVALMRWLCRLVTPKGGLILDPFLGSGTTIIAALQEGFRCVGIEREAEYVEIARRRVEEDAPLFNRGVA